jgi:hypothetical protein
MPRAGTRRAIDAAEAAKIGELRRSRRFCRGSTPHGQLPPRSPRSRAQAVHPCREPARRRAAPPEGRSGRGSTAAALAENSGAGAASRAANPHGIARCRGRPPRAHSGAASGGAVARWNAARHGRGGRGEVGARSGTRRVIDVAHAVEFVEPLRAAAPVAARRANAQRPPRSPRAPAPACPSVPRTRAASCGAA